MISTIPVISVSQLNKQIRLYLENEVGVIHIEGEVSNLSKPASGHCYFTLKDSTAQIRCVFFKNRHTQDSRQILADGQKIVAAGHVSLYEARGDYQLIVEHIQDAGLGLLYQQFEALKKKLAAEGLFDASRKKSLPDFPQIIAIVTSATGAALRDILSTLKRRFPIASVLIFASEVQGNNAAQHLVNALVRAEKDARADVIIVARGGGSMEDLCAFNAEILARKIAACPIPIVSGVGHETDFTIADFVADYRAATPTGAAEAVTPDIMDLLLLFKNMENRLQTTMGKYLEYANLKLAHLWEKIKSPATIIATHAQTLDYLQYKLNNSIEQLCAIKIQQLTQLQTALHRHNPALFIKQSKGSVQQIQQLLSLHMQNLIQKHQQQFSNRLSTLHAVSPLATLERGYAIASKDGEILYSVQQVQTGDCINVRLHQGSLSCQIIEQQESAS